MKIFIFVIGTVAAVLMVLSKRKKIWIPSLIVYCACVLSTTMFFD